MLLLSANNLKKTFGDEALFDDVSFNIETNDKIGLVGINGAGKSTLFKILTGELPSDGGELYLGRLTKIGYLDQYACAGSERTLEEEILTVFDRVMRIEAELERLRFEIEKNPENIDELVERQHRLNEEYSSLDGFYYRSRARAALLGLGFSEEELSLRVSSLSGGQKTRLALGKILLSDCNLLLLDEPTNHLDIASVEWLEGFLSSYSGAFAVISHDRYFLDRVTNRTFELDCGRLRSQNGNYTFFAKQREIERLTEQRRYDNIKKEIERLEGVVEQQRRWNREKNIKTAESKLKVIERLEKELVKPEEALAETAFAFKALPGGADDVLVCRGLCKKFDGKVLFENADFDIKRGERVFLLGPNGCGKTTLLKIILGKCAADGGEYKIGSSIKTGYYDQLQAGLNVENTVLEEVWNEYPRMTLTQIRNALAVFLFRGEEVFKEISKLSGGERSRVELVKLILRSVNFLVLDEPTNHLDLQSKEALESALSAYDGTLLIVSHDRYFISRLADKILWLDNDGIRCFNGGYEYFCEKFKQRLDAAPQKKADRGADYREQKRIESERRKLNTRLSRTEALIAETEEKIAELTGQLEDPETAADYQKSFELSTKIDELNGELERLYTKWEEVSLLLDKQ